MHPYPLPFCVGEVPFHGLDLGASSFLVPSLDALHTHTHTRTHMSAHWEYNSLTKRAIAVVVGTHTHSYAPDLNWKLTRTQVIPWCAEATLYRTHCAKAGTHAHDHTPGRHMRPWYTCLTTAADEAVTLNDARRGAREQECDPSCVCVCVCHSRVAFTDCVG